MDPEDLVELAEVIVIGEHPGPALWQVKSGDHTLWILGEVSPLPAKLTWRSKQVERILSTAQQVIVPGGIPDGLPRPGKGSSTASRNAASVEARNLPDGKTLKDVLSPETYARFAAAKRRFARGDRQIERMTPGHANNRLLTSAFKVLELEPAAHPVSVTVSKLAQKAAINVVHVEIDAPEQEIPRARVDLPAACQPPEPLLAQLDDGGMGWKALANAWSIGDTGALRLLVPANAIIAGHVEKCAAASDGLEHLQDEALVRQRAAWLGAAEHALAVNTSSLAVVQMAELFAPEGLVAALRAGGYEVVEP
jgi:uncharacterized protein YbaP (TraB family)